MKQLLLICATTQRMKPRIFPHVSALALAVALGANTASAAVIATADFEDNTIGSIVGEGGGSGWTSNWSSATTANVVSGGLSYSNGSVASNGGSHAMEIIPGTAVSTPALERSLSTQTVTLYMSFLWRDSANNDSPTASTDFTQVGFDPSATDGNPNLSFLRNSGNLLVRAGGAGGADSGVDANIGTTYMIVLKATRVGGANYTGELWVNPSSLTEGSPDATIGDTGIGNIGTFLVRTANHEDGDAFQIDNIRVGTEWSDVVLAVPEPSAALLGGLGILTLLRRRRA